jgi:hypothetical protein
VRQQELKEAGVTDRSLLYTPACRLNCNTAASLFTAYKSHLTTRAHGLGLPVPDLKELSHYHCQFCADDCSVRVATLLNRKACLRRAGLSLVPRGDPRHPLSVVVTQGYVLSGNSTATVGN